MCSNWNEHSPKGTLQWIVVTGHFQTSFTFAGGSVQLPLGLRQSLSYKLLSVSPYMCITSLLLVDRLATCVISAIRPYATTALLVSRGQTHPCVKFGLSLLRGVALTSCCGIEY